MFTTILRVNLALIALLFSLPAFAAGPVQQLTASPVGRTLINLTTTNAMASYLGVSGGAPAGTVIGTGTPSANALPIYLDTSGTNVTPSKITTSSLTNLYAGTVTVTNNLTVQGTLTASNSVGNSGDVHISNGAGAQTAWATPTNGLTVQGNKIYVTNVQPSQLIGPNFSLNGLASPPSLTYIGFQITNSIVGDIDVYTVPAGRKAFCSAARLWTPSTTNNTIYFEGKTNGTYYRISSNIALTGSATGGGSSFGGSGSLYILEAGETLAFNVSALNADINGSIITFPNTYNLSTFRINTPVTGTNTIFTCPANTTALILNPFSATPQSPFINWFNNSGGSRTVIVHLVKSGDVIGNWNELNNTGFTSSSSTVQNIAGAIGVVLSSGDFIDVTLDAGTATQFFYVTIFQF